MDLDFDKFFKISLICTKINRSHPDIPRDKKWFQQFLVMQGMFTLNFLLMTYSMVFHDIKNGNFVKICENGICAVFYIVVTFKYCIMLWHQKRLKHLMKTMKYDYELTMHQSPEERSIVLKYAKNGQWLIIPWVFNVLGLVVIFLVKPMMLMLYYTIKGQFAFVPVFDITYPAALEKAKDSVLPFILMYLVMTTYVACAACMYIGIVPFGPIFMQHACGQLELVKRRVLNLFPEHGYSPERSKAELKTIVIHLDNVYKFVEDIKNIFQINYELTLKGTIITVPIALYQILETYRQGQVSLEFISVLVAVCSFSIYPCYYSDLLLGMSESLRTAIYTCGWERHRDLRARTSLLVLLTRTARPVAIRSLFNTLCLDTLTGVFQQAYSIFNVINAAW